MALCGSGLAVMPTTIVCLANFRIQLTALRAAADTDRYLSSLARLPILGVFLLTLMSGAASADDTSNNLLVFVGERIEIKQVANTPPPAVIALDLKFEARYKVLTVIFGAYTGSEIDFAVFDHYGRPAFANYETVVLYVSRYDGQLIHQKYQFNPVYRTADGRWAGCGDPYQHEPEVHRGPLRARPIDFRPEVAFSVSGLPSAEIKKRYPSEYFSRNGDVVKCTAGAYAEELFEAKRNGVLKARGVFK